jgi:hypothetical protein
MKFFRLDLLTLLISLFILNSCKNQDSVGLGVNASSQTNTNLVDTSTIVINTVPEDSVQTSGIVKNPLAYFIDPIFGTSIASLGTDLNLPNSGAYTPPTGTITIDSSRLILNYQNGFYGDSITSKYTVNVYQLNEKFNAATTAYFNTKQWNYNSNTLLGTLTFNARTHDSIKVFNIIAGAPDTLIKVPPQIRIPISNNFVNSILFNASSDALGSNAIFQNDTRGLYITLDRTKTTGPGGVFMISNADTLAVYYHTVSGTTIDTAVVKLPINNMAASIQHNYTSTIKNELNNTSGSRNTFYLQGLGGLRAKVSFPNLLKNLRASLVNRPSKKDSDIVINRAELVITPPTYSIIPYAPIPKITMYQLDIAHQRVEIQDATTTDPRSGGVSVFGGFYNSSENEYHFIVTAYIQDLLLGKTVDYGTYLGPIDINSTDASTTVDIAATPQVGSRTVAIGSDHTTSNSTNRIKLNIIYTKIAK